MVRLTALSFMLAGGALWLAARNARVPAIAAAALLIPVGLAVLLRMAFAWDVSIDQLSLAQLPVAVDSHTPPRMAPATATAFVLLGLSLIFAQQVRTAAPHQALTVLCMSLGWVGLSRYVFGG